jgi:ABC-type glycerol-3-phosphate transport system substrate-binding protein
MEQELKEPELSEGENFLAVFTEEGGNISYYSWLYTGPQKVINRYSLIDGAYNKSQVTCFDEFLEGKEHEISLCLGEDGLYYLLMQGIEVLNQGTETESYKFHSRLLRSNKELTSCEEVTLASWNQEDSGGEHMKGTRVSNIQITSDGILLYEENYENDKLSYNLIDEKPFIDLDVLSESEYLVRGNTLYYIPQGLLEIRALDCATGQIQQYQCETLQKNSKIQVSKEGTLYLLDENGIHRLAKDATLWETVVDGSLYSMSFPSLEAGSFLVGDGEKEVYYAFYRSRIEGNGDLLACYKFDESVSATIEKELTIYSLWENTTLREAISQYQKNHTDVRIKYLVAMNDESGADLAEQIRVLNTEVLAGEGADIFLLDGLPMDSYIDKGVLMNIGDVLSPMVKDGSLLSNIANNYVQDDAIYGMPIRFYVPLYTTSENIKEDTASLNQLSQLAASSEKKLFPLTTYDNLLQMFLYTYYNNLVNDLGELSESELKTFLTQVKVVADNIGSDSESQGVSIGIYGGMQGDNTRVSQILSQNAIQLISESSLAVMGYTGDVSDFKLVNACAVKSGGAYYPVNNSYVPNGIIGMNKASKETELAKDFIQYLFSEENQLVHVGDGFPVNTTAFDSWIDEKEKENVSVYISTIDENGNTIGIQPENLTPEQTQGISTTIKQLTTPVNNNAYLIDMIVEESLPYFTGEKDLDTVCQNIINKVNLYLSE